MFHHKLPTLCLRFGLSTFVRVAEWSWSWVVSVILLPTASEVLALPSFVVATFELPPQTSGLLLEPRPLP